MSVGQLVELLRKSPQEATVYAVGMEVTDVAYTIIRDYDGVEHEQVWIEP